MKNILKNYDSLPDCFSGSDCVRMQPENESSSAEKQMLPEETISLDQTKEPLTFEHENGAGVDVTEDGEANENTQASSAAESAASGETANTPAETSVFAVPVTEIVKVTEADGQTATDAKGQEQTEVVKVTEYVPVTEAGGQAATDAAGQPRTEPVEVTETVASTEPAEQPATLKPTEAYTPSYDLCKAYWLDMSQESDFFFEGEFLIIEFEVNNNIPDGSYPVTIAQTDIASWDLVAWTPDIINGEVAVNTQIQPQADPDDDFTLKVRSVSAKPGDTVKVAIDLSHNPGFCGFTLDIQYDKSAMTIVDTYGGSDFINTAINYVTH